MNSATNKATETTNSKAFESKADQNKALIALRLGFDTVSDIATRMGLPKTRVNKALKSLEKDGRAFYDYAVNGWKLEA